jgi:hypothetical protein
VINKILIGSLGLQVSNLRFIVKKIEELLSRAQERFAKDHTSLCGGVDILMIITSFIFAALGMNFTFCVTGLSLGVVVLCLSLILRSRATEKQTQYTQTLMGLERERAKFAQKQAVLSHIYLYGMPEGTPLAQIQILLGDNPSVSTAETWKQLPKPE